MGTLFLVRHGQASFGAENYDQLSALGHAQAARLGAYWQSHALRFDAVFTGTLQRHQQTLAGIAEGYGAPLPEAQALTALNEYDSHALLQALPPVEMPAPNTPECYRAHFRRLCDALAQWMDGVISPQGMPAWADFSAGVQAVLETMRTEHAGQQVLLVSSGGPIACALSLVLGTAPEMAIALNMRMRNTSVTELGITPKRLMLQTFNALPHLNAPADLDLITFA